MRAKHIILAVLIACGTAPHARAAGAPAAVEQSAASEDELRAAFLLNFARFVTWPAERPDDPTPLVFAVAGDATFAATLERVVRGQTVRGRPLAVVALKGTMPPSPVHLLYIASARDRRVGDWLVDAAQATVLTVSGATDFCRQGGMIRMYSESQRMRFEINLPLLQRSGLRASSRLLALSRPAGGGP